MGVRRRFDLIGAALIVSLWSSVSVAAADPAQNAADFVQALGDEAIAVLQTPDITDEQRNERYRDLLDRGFALDTISRFVLGRHWRTATEEQRAEYRSLFREYVLDTYASQLNNYTGETFAIVKSLALDDKDTMVNTEIRRPEGPPIRVDYRVRVRKESHKVVDIRVEGVSLVITQRSEFASIIARDGVDGLLQLLREYEPPETGDN